VTEAAPAKINLSLHVTGRRADGYHLLESLVVFTRAEDVVHAEPAGRDSLAITGPFAAGLSADEDNLVLRARDALRSIAHFPPVALILEKHLPIASGIGGGSADAAATLRLLTRLFDLPPDAAARAAPRLGADAPMCLASATLVARGVGEEISPVATLPRLAMVLVNPGEPVSTPAVFSALASKHNPPLPPLPMPDAEGDRLPLEAFWPWLARTRNDLQMPATRLSPIIADALHLLSATGPYVARMSGSGATCFGIYPTRKSAEVAATIIRAQEPSWWVVATETLEPDAGAMVQTDDM
jgi:4-diphosphocytidyl-2-C-methyl-D-erythritol kinase